MKDCAEIYKQCEKNKVGALFHPPNVSIYGKWLKLCTVQQMCVCVCVCVCVCDCLCFLKLASSTVKSPWIIEHSITATLGKANRQQTHRTLLGITWTCMRPPTSSSDTLPPTRKHLVQQGYSSEYSLWADGNQLH